MAIKLGSTNFGSVYLGSTKMGPAYLGNVKVYSSVPNYNPLNLPPYTIRFRFADGGSPSRNAGILTRVSTSPNVWDLTYTSPDWSKLFYGNGLNYWSSESVLEILGANSTNVTNMDSMFYKCSNLTSVALFDTSSVTNLGMAFYQCSSLTSIPRFDTHLVTSFVSTFYQCTSLASIGDIDTSASTDMQYTWGYCPSLTALPKLNLSSSVVIGGMCYGCSSLRTIPPLIFSNNLKSPIHAFQECVNVESGAYDMYLTLSAIPDLWSYSDTFTNCGSNTVTGRADLARIPRSWGGTGS